MQTLFRQVIDQAGLQDVAMCLYALSPPTTSETKPLFFYHLAKAGGIAVHTALDAAFHIQAILTPAPGHRYFRYHADDDFSESFYQELYNADLRAISYVGIIGLNTFGEHEKFAARPFNLMTTLRDPFDRLVSHYFYYRRRGERTGPLTEADFLDFAQDWRNTYFQSRLMCRDHGPDRDPTDICQEARANLDGFDFVATIDQLETLLLNVWSVYDFAPVLTQKLHSNPKKELDFEYLRDDIYEMNRGEKELVDHFSGALVSPRPLAPETTANLALPGWMAVAIDLQKDAQFVGDGRYLSTKDFFERLNGGATSLAEFVGPRH